MRKINKIVSNYIDKNSLNKYLNYLIKNNISFEDSINLINHKFIILSSNAKKLKALKETYEKSYKVLNDKQLYEDYSKLIRKIKINNLNLLSQYSDYCPINISEIDIGNIPYAKLENMNFHWALNKYLEKTDLCGIPMVIGENSIGIDKNTGIFFSKGVEGVLELWETWLKWRYYRLFNPLYEGLTEEEIESNKTRYQNRQISDIEQNRWYNFIKHYNSNEFLTNEEELEELFQYQYAELNNSSYFHINLDGLGFNPDKSIDYNKIKYLEAKKQESTNNIYQSLKIQYGNYSNLNSSNSDKWNYKICNESLGLNEQEKIIISTKRISLLNISGVRDLNSILLYFYKNYKEKVSKGKQVNFDILDKYCSYIKKRKETEEQEKEENKKL